MFSPTILVTVAFATLAAATQTITGHPPKPTPEPISECSTGGAHCCNEVVLANDPTAVSILNSLDIVVVPENVLVGITCTPITIGGGGGTCNQHPVCCENNEFNGLINIGCTTIIL